MKRLLGKYSELFILKAFTKSYGMAGIRLGYCLCGDRKLLADMGRAVQPWNVSLPAQMAGVAALQEIEFLQQTKQIIQTERAWLCEQLKQLGIAVCQSRANYLLFYSREELGSKLMERGIQIRDCSNYHGLGNGWYRIAVRLRADNIQLISAVRDALEEL